MRGASGENAPTSESPLLVDRYAIYDAIASGGMATVHLGRLIGTAGFLRTVAIKRLHSQFAHDADFTAMFLDEARLASRIQHPNVVSTLDVVMNDNELLLVMEYVRGESLSRLIRRARDRGVPLPPRVVVAIMSGALHGLHAAHEAVDEKGALLGLVHRDMSPQNVLVGTDGVARVLDFGVAKAAGRVHTTRDGDIKGKVLYMPPEQLSAEPLGWTRAVPVGRRCADRQQPHRKPDAALGLGAAQLAVHRQPVGRRARRSGDEPAAVGQAQRARALGLLEGRAHATAHAVEQPDR